MSGVILNGIFIQVRLVYVNDCKHVIYVYLANHHSVRRDKNGLQKSHDDESVSPRSFFSISARIKSRH